MNAKSRLAVIATRNRRAGTVLCLLLAGLAGVARGDWLVLASGEQVETRGPWTLDGRKVVFTSMRGVLSSVRASSVNIDSSRELTTRKHEDATRVVVASAVPKQEPVLVLTDADFAKPVAPPPGAVVVPAAAAGGETPAAEPVIVPAADSLETRVAHQMPGPPAVRITSWSSRPTGDEQLSIFGTVQNVGSLVAAAITVGVKLIDSEGAQLGTSEAAVSTTALMPGVQADFEARFEGNPAFSRLEFKVDTVELEIGKPEGESAAKPAAPPKGGQAAAPANGDQPATARPSGDQPQGDEPHARAAGAATQPKPQAPKPEG